MNMRQDRVVAAGVDELDDVFSGTDPLTGFGDRARLVLDLTLALELETPMVLAVFSLTGSEGHRTELGAAANDERLAVLGKAFEQLLGPDATHYRPRRDEFCALIRGGLDEAAELLLATEQELRRIGGSAGIGASFGTALLPHEASDPVELLIIADDDLRAHSSGHPPRERRRTPPG